MQWSPEHRTLDTLEAKFSGMAKALTDIEIDSGEPAVLKLVNSTMVVELAGLASIGFFIRKAAKAGPWDTEWTP